MSQAVQGMWKQTGGFGWLRGKWFKRGKLTHTFEFQDNRSSDSASPCFSQAFKKHLTETGMKGE